MDNILLKVLANENVSKFKMVGNGSKSKQVIYSSLRPFAGCPFSDTYMAVLGFYRCANNTSLSIQIFVINQNILFVRHEQEVAEASIWFFLCKNSSSFLFR